MTALRTTSRTRIRTLGALTVLPLAALAVGLPALPASASTSYQSGCTVADAYSSASIPNEAPLSHVTPWTSVSVDPQAETIRASSDATFDSLPSGEACDVVAEYRDVITVVGAGMAPGTPVTLTALVTVAGDLATFGDGELHAAEAGMTATFSLRDRLADFGVPDVLSVTAQGQAHDRQAGPAPDDYSRFSHSVYAGEDLVDESFDSDLVDGVRSFSAGGTPFTLTAKVGDVLDVLSKVTSSAVVYDGTADAHSTVEEFSVKLTSATPGVVLDRGDAPEEEPTPTAADTVTEAQDLLASYALPKGIANSLGVKLAHAQRDLAAGADACDDLASFSAQVSAQRGKKLTAEQADALTAKAAEASALVPC